MARPLICFSVLVLCQCFIQSDAVTLDEVYQTIDAVGEQIRLRESWALKDAVSEAFALAIDPLQRSCINNQKGVAFDGFNTGLGQELSQIRREYGLQTADELASVDMASVDAQVRGRLEGAVSSLGYRLSQIRQCVMAWSGGQRSLVDMALGFGVFAMALVRM